jgi:hypothetical protein
LAVQTMAKHPHDGSPDTPPASSPCMAGVLDEAGRPMPDPNQLRDVSQWRKAERERLIALRMGLPPEDRAALTEAIVR